MADLDIVVKARNNALASGRTITYRGHELKPAFSVCKLGAIQLNTNKCNEGVIIVPDSVIEGAKKVENIVLADYVAETPEEIDKNEEYIKEFIESNFQNEEIPYEEWYKELEDKNKK